MSTQASVQSIEALKDLRVALALFADDTLGALGAVDAEVRRTMQWLQYDRRTFWAEQIKRRREQVSSAQAEVFKRKLAQKPDYKPAMSEQLEALRKAQGRLQDAEKRAAMVKKWEPALQQAMLEYHGATRRISTLAGGDVPRALALLDRIIESLESYLRVAPPSGTISASPLAKIADSLLAEMATPPAEPPSERPEAPPEPSEPQPDH